MKHLFLYLFLILFTFQTLSHADDIRDFQIEGISIGDSVLDYFSKQEIENNTKDYYTYKNNFAFFAIDIENHESLKQYYGVQFHVKKNDKNYIIHALSGYSYCKNDINDCYNQTKKIEKDFLNMFKDLRIKRINYSHEADKSGKSKVKTVKFYFTNGNAISINTYDWADNMPYSDNYDVSLDTAEFISALKK